MTNQTKWADYIITAVDAKNRINELKIYPDEGNELGEPQIWRRGEVITRIEMFGISFVTAVENDNDGKFTKGDDVIVVTVQGKKYLRTDGNKVAEDNLGNLPILKKQ